jgi:hypothetical protein
MKISELANIILEICSPNKSQKLIEGIIWERLHLRNYNKLLSEQVVEDEELENNVEDEKQPDIILAEPEEKGIEKGLDGVEEPEATVDNEEEPELNAEPEAEEPEAEVEPEEPTSTGPILGKDTEVPAATVEPSKTIKTISPEQARELLSYKGKIFNAIFTKKNGERRAMKGMVGVRKHTSGGTLPYSPKDKGVIPVYDLKIGNGPRGYRMLNLAGLEALNINGQQYKIDQSIQSKDKIQEIKVNNPIITTELVLELLDEVMHAKRGNSGKIVNMLEELGFDRTDGTSGINYIKDHPELNNTFYTELKKIKNQLDEIKVNNPSISYNEKRVDNYKPFEKGKNCKQTIYNLVKANPYLTEKQVVEILVEKEQMYNPKVVLDNIRYSPGVKRQQVVNPKTKKKIFVYFA